LPGRNHPLVRHRAGVDAKVATLGAVVTLRTANTQELARLARAGDCIEVPTGGTLVSAGRRSDWIYLILEGSAVAGFPHYLFGPGDWLGVLGCLADEPGPLTFLATTPVRALAIRTDRFMALLDTAPSLRRTITASLARELVQTLRRQAQRIALVAYDRALCSANSAGVVRTRPGRARALSRVA
jgi:CRP-like cAMP-binding protein